MAEVAAGSHAFALNPASNDAAFAVTLPLRIYTIHASGAGDSTGVALVEAYVVEYPAWDRRANGCKHAA